MWTIFLNRKGHVLLFTTRNVYIFPLNKRIVNFFALLLIRGKLSLRVTTVGSKIFRALAILIFVQSQRGVFGESGWPKSFFGANYFK